MVHSTLLSQDAYVELACQHGFFNWHMEVLPYVRTFAFFLMLPYGVNGQCNDSYSSSPHSPKNLPPQHTDQFRLAEQFWWLGLALDHF